MWRGWRSGLSCLALAGLLGCATSAPLPDYSEYVWPPPPDKARIQLEDIIYGRSDVRAKSGLQRALIGASPQSPYDWLSKPFGVAFDPQGRLLVTDTPLGALFRFDRPSQTADVFGTRGAVTLKSPLGLGVGPDGTAYVADVGLRQVVALDPEGDLRAVYGKRGDLENPTDAEPSPDGTKLFVADSKAHRIVVFDIQSGERLSSFGQRGEGEGEFAFPTSLAFDGAGNLLVVDQINSRVQVLTEDGTYLDEFGSLGVGFANFVRPKDVAVDELDIVYVTDAAFNNVQIFSPDYELLTFVGGGGGEPGHFQIASGVAVQGDRFAVVDQLNRRVQVFRFIVPKDAE
jgi:DNA-binding beta-propeller fold protein YncE